MMTPQPARARRVMSDELLPGRLHVHAARQQRRRGLRPDPDARPARPARHAAGGHPPRSRHGPPVRRAHPQRSRHPPAVRQRGDRGAPARRRRPARPQPRLQPWPGRPRLPRPLPQPRRPGRPDRCRVQPRRPRSPAMTPGALLGAVAGSMAAAGITCVISYAAGPPPEPVPAPPARWRILAARWKITPRHAVTAVIAAIAVLAVTGWPAAALAAMPAVIAVPRILSRRLADVLAASRGLEDALTHSAATAPPPIACPVGELAASLRRREDTARALRAFADAVDDPVGDLIATALILAADRRGPGLHAVLTELAGDVAK